MTRSARTAPPRAKARMRWCLAGCLALLTWTAGLAHAGSIGVAPIRLVFNGERSISHVTLTNVSQETLAIEAGVIPWQEGDPGQTARDLVVNPPVATLAPGARLTLRVGLIRRPVGDQEHAYRLYVTELPAPRSADAQGVGVRLRVGIPVFVAARQPQPVALQWSHRVDEQGLLLLAHNPGNVHQKVQQVRVIQNEERSLATQGLPYVLPGATGMFRVPGLVRDAARPLQVEVQADETWTPVEVPGL